MKYEYKILEITPGNGRTGQSEVIVRHEAELNRWGALGWEVVQVVMSSDNATKYLLKRKE